jgi:ribosomal protein S18 acetylase RimI-like enzyme
MAIEIRKATQKDFETIQNLTKKLNIDQYKKYDTTINPDFAFTSGGKTYLKKILDSNGVIFLAEKDSISVGFIVVSIETVGNFRTLDAYSEIDLMYVDKLYRNQGIGHQLIVSVEKWSQSQDILHMRVVASASNKKAIALYKKHSFKEYDLILEKEL